MTPKQERIYLLASAKEALVGAKTLLASAANALTSADETAGARHAMDAMRDADSALELVWKGLE